MSDASQTRASPDRSLRMFLWRTIGRLAFRLTLHPAYRVRRLILVAFGAEAHPTSRIRRTAWIDRPWNIRFDELSLVGDRAILIAVDRIEIGKRTTVSQLTKLVTTARDPGRPDLAENTAPIRVGDDCWVAADTLVMPGVTIESGSVIGARAFVDRDIPAWSLAIGEPAKRVKERLLKGVHEPAGATPP